MLQRRGALFPLGRKTNRSLSTDQFQENAITTSQSFRWLKPVADFPWMFKHMATAERVEAAKQKTERVVDHLFQLIALHENNAIVVYSDTLALQIPRSYAANAFNVFRQGLHRFEIMRLCALWDRAWPDLSRESIPTIVELIADSNVIDALVEETRSTWTSRMPPADPPDDPKTDAAVRSR